MTSLKKILTIVTLALCTISFAACNTMQGAGKDLERGGEKLQNQAR
jgi:entericidin B